jgi:hypothetical protein
MRLWTLHPKYLDPQGLVALWREALLAQKVFRGLTRGYQTHPQLKRFRDRPNPVACIATFLESVQAEATERGYRFDASKIARSRTSRRLVETEGQLLYEWEHLKRKLKLRHPARFAEVSRVRRPEPHPLFRIVAGEVRGWERVRDRET